MSLDIENIKEELKNTKDVYERIKKIYNIILNMDSYADKFNLLSESIKSHFYIPITKDFDIYFEDDVSQKLFYIHEVIIDNIWKELSEIKKPDEYIDKLHKIIFDIPLHEYRVQLVEKLGLIKLSQLTKNLDKEQKAQITSRINLLGYEVLEKIENDKRNYSDDKKCALLYAKWLPYITTYKANLIEIKNMINKCYELININMGKWINYNNTPKLNMTDFVYELKKCETDEKVIVCTLLRRIIETIFALQIFNNRNSLSGNFVHRGLNSYYKFFKKENIDWKIKTLIVSDDNKRNYKYVISKIWKNKRYLTKKIYNKLLSNNIHQQWEGLISFKYFNQLEDFNWFNNYVNNKHKELNDLLSFLDELSESLRNHLVEFEKGKLKILVRNFQINTYSIVDKFFDFEDNYKFEEFTDFDYEYLKEVLNKV